MKPSERFEIPSRPHIILGYYSGFVGSDSVYRETMPQEEIGEAFNDPLAQALADYRADLNILPPSSPSDPAGFHLDNED